MSINSAFIVPIFEFQLGNNLGAQYFKTLCVEFQPRSFICLPYHRFDNYAFYKYVAGYITNCE